jgi:hypothetical protein
VTKLGDEVTVEADEFFLLVMRWLSFAAAVVIASAVELVVLGTAGEEALTKALLEDGHSQLVKLQCLQSMDECHCRGHSTQ